MEDYSAAVGGVYDDEGRDDVQFDLAYGDSVCQECYLLGSDAVATAADVSAVLGGGRG